MKGYLCTLESESGYSAVSIPAHQQTRFMGGETWQLSLLLLFR